VISRVTQGSQPVGPSRRITRCEQHLVLELDDRPALEVLAEDLHLDLSEPRRALPTLRQTLVGLRAVDAVSDSSSRTRHFGPDVRVRHLIGLDPSRQAFAVADQLESGMQLAFCRRDVQAARRDLVRVCSEIREELGETLTAVAFVHFARSKVDIAVLETGLGGRLDATNDKRILYCTDEAGQAGALAPTPNHKANVTSLIHIACVS